LQPLRLEVLSIDTEVVRKMLATQFVLVLTLDVVRFSTAIAATTLKLKISAMAFTITHFSHTNKLRSQM
jgi:hypothetical protein